MSNKGIILIVQATQANAEPLQTHFEIGEYKVLMTNNGQEALALARRELPRAIVLDLDTPGLDAAAVMREMRNMPRTRHIHITLLTQRGERADLLDALAVGADEFMIKPVDVEELGLRVRNALRRAAFDNLTNPTTGLPGPRLIEEELRQILRRSDDTWVILRLNIRHFNHFNDLYGFLSGEEVLRFAAHLFAQVVDHVGTSNDFLGHSGADNFILITTIEQTPKLVEEATTRFNEEVKMHYSYRERKRGTILIPQPDGTEKETPLMALKVQMVKATDGPFSDIRELTQSFS